MFENGICHALEIHIFGIIASIAYLLKVLASHFTIFGDNWPFSLNYLSLFHFQSVFVVIYVVKSNWVKYSFAYILVAIFRQIKY